MKLASLSLAVVAVAMPAIAQTANGTITVNGKKATLNHVVAVQKDKNVRLLISDKEVTPAQLADDFAMHDLKDLSGIEVEIAPDGQIPTGNIFSPLLTKFNGSFSTTGMHKWDGKITAGAIEGKLWMEKPDDFFDNTYVYTATIKAPISEGPKSGGPPVIKGKSLGAGGGEPGKAYFAYLKILRAGDSGKILANVSSTRAKQMKPEELKKMLPLIQAMIPDDIKYVSGGMDGDHATLNLSGKDHGSKATGTVDMVRESGAWKVDKESWETKS
jgi:hypothetical protein